MSFKVYGRNITNLTARISLTLKQFNFAVLILICKNFVNFQAVCKSIQAANFHKIFNCNNFIDFLAV